MEIERKGMMVFAGNSHPELAQSIARKLGISLGSLTAYRKTNRGQYDDEDYQPITLTNFDGCKETNVEIGESVRGRDVYIIQTGTKNVNNDIMELLILAYACKTSCARKIIGVLPYLPYCKQSKMRKRGCIVSKLLAKMFTKAGINHVITMDLHQKEIQGFFDISVDNLRASPFLLQYIQESIPDYRNAVIVARNPNSVKRATSYAERLRLGIAVIHGETKTESEIDDGRNSPPPHPLDIEQLEMAHRTQASGFEIFPVLAAKEKPAMNIVGDVGGRIAILVDDLIDDVESFVVAAEILKERGAYKIYVMATHGLLSSDAPRLIESSPIDEVVVTNTVPHEVQKMQCHKIKTVDISVMLCESIRRIHNNESMSYLFKNISTED